jgi:SPP1 gp7 family putative phage head morphogenesis protein
MDKGHRETDRLIDDLEKRIQSVYARAAKETQEKLDTYMESFKAKDKKKREEVAAGTLSKSDYAKWRTGQIMVGKRWEEMLDTLSTDLANADKLAQSITQGYMYDAYALNHNYATFLVEQDSLVDTSYTLYDRHTVERLIRDEPNLLPAPTPGSKRDRELREGRIERWNAQKITSEVTQGILQGESVDKIASRMRNVAAMGSRAARRNARTAVTGAENAGRQAGFERAQDMGIDTEKQWLATMDDRTRHEHRLLDGVHVPVDEDFEVDGYKIEYPGDPSAEPEMVYNCRCTMICRIKGFEKDFTDRHNDALGDMTYDEWKHQHEKKIKKPEEITQFIPATTLEEAEEYTRQNFVIDSRYAGEGNVSFKGMSLDNANAINEELTKLFAENDLPRFRNIGMMNFREKIWKEAKDAPMAYRGLFHGELFFNGNILKSEKTLKAYMKKGKDAFDFCINNINKFSGKQLEMVKRYKEAGRQTVADSSDNPIKAMLDHEIGHHIDHQIIMKNKEFAQITKDGMDEYGIKISGYALHTRGEYVAESFCAFETGLGDIDPKLYSIFEKAVRR